MVLWVIVIIENMNEIGINTNIYSLYKFLTIMNLN